MGIDATAVARGAGITTVFKDLAGGRVRYLPQRIALIAQGEAGLSYSSDKFTVTAGANEVGQTLGYSSPAYLMAREFFPVNGDGVGTIPVDVIPLQESAGATAAAGDITPAGTATDALRAMPTGVGRENILQAHSFTPRRVSYCSLVRS